MAGVTMVLKKSLKNGFKLQQQQQRQQNEDNNNLLPASQDGRGNNNGTLQGGRAKSNGAGLEVSSVVGAKQNDQDLHLRAGSGTLDEEETEEEEAPDGGWGWMVTIGLIVVFVSSLIKARCLTSL